MRGLLLLFLALVVAGGLAIALVPDGRLALRAEKSGKQTPRQSQAVAVEVAPAIAARYQEDLRSVGSLMSDESVQIASEIAGRIQSFEFAEGQAVKAGDVLVKLDDALARAELEDAKARFELARANRERAQLLRKQGHMSQQAYDEAAANYQIAEAALELTSVKLAKHAIKAPFDGIVGLRNASTGAYVNIGTPIVNLEKIDFLKIDFKLPEIALTQISPGQDVNVEVDAVPGRTFKAQVYAISPMVDVNGRALHVRARMANPDLLLRPGLFARITVKGRETREVVAVPESAIVPRGGESFVYVIQGGRAVESKVKLGKRENGTVQVLSGLSAGSIVVVAGQLKLKDGAPVEVVQTVSGPEPEKS